MVRPKQRVILYTGGLRKIDYQRNYNNKRNLEKPDFFECPGCGRAVKKGEQGLLKKHYSDLENKIHCPEGVDKVNPGGTTNKGVKRGPYKPRQAKRVIDRDRKSVDTLKRAVLQ